MSADGFWKITYTPPGTLDPAQRARNWDQVVVALTGKEAQVQATRCMSCGSPGCNTGCPLGQDIPAYQAAVTRGDMYGAHNIAFHRGGGQYSFLYWQLGTVCPQLERLCESSCTVGHINLLGAPKGTKVTNTVVIGGTEAAIGEEAIKNGWLKYPKPLKYTGKRVAIIGTGPGGVYHGMTLNALGHEAHFFEANDQVGGLLQRGLPDFKLSKKDFPLIRRLMKRAGALITTKSRIGKRGEFTIKGNVIQRLWQKWTKKRGHNLSIDDLLNKYDMVTFAGGTYSERGILHPDTHQPILGSDLAITGLSFLFPYNDHVASGNPDLPAHLDQTGKDIIVIGGGDTGFDVVRTAFRAGAQSVTVILRGIEFRGAEKERAFATAEVAALAGQGIHLESELQVNPIEIKRRASGKFALTLRNGTNGGEQVIEGDVIVGSTGFEKPDIGKIFGINDLTVHADGTTSDPRLFVVGDALNGASLAVHAAAHGRHRAFMVHSKLEEQPASQRPNLLVRAARRAVGFVL
ncbi:MAG: hypothetical protein EB059_06565 [Alphaproteobacteria bacterium]|nr:hypothetical protein [Alphaproteobacteria bacterium]